MERTGNITFFSIGGRRLLLKVALLASGIGLTNHFVTARIDYFLQYDLYFPLMVFAGVWTTAIVALLYIAFTPLTGARLSWALLVGLSTLAAEVYHQVVGDRLTVEALDAMWDPDMVNAGTVAFYGRETVRALLGVSLLLCGLLIPAPPLGIPRWRSLWLLPLLPSGLIAGIIVYVGGSTGLETRGLPSQFHNLGLFSVYALIPAPKLERQDVTIPRTGDPAARHIVLIVDESVSGDFVDLNVPRGTTPFLAAGPAGVVNFGLATAASNCSNSSNVVLRMGANPHLLGASGYSPLANPSIWKYARAAGFATRFIGAKYLTETGQNLMSPAEIRLIDQVLSVPDAVPPAARDASILQLLADALEQPEPQFIYVNKQGVHFPYQRYASDGEPRFQPTMKPMEGIADRERLVNSYKNAIHFAVDRFFEDLLPRIDLRNTAIIYTSDHGQNLLDDGKPVTHCRRSDTNMYEVAVPLFAWAGEDGLRQAFGTAAAVNFGAASHFEIFPTLLVLLGYDPAIVRERYHQSLFEPIEQPLGYVSGPITGRFGQRPDWHSRDDIYRLDR